MSRDVCCAARSLRRTPAFTAAAILTLGIGIGANTAIFSLIEAVVLRTLPVGQPAPRRCWRDTSPPGAPRVSIPL